MMHWAHHSPMNLARLRDAKGWNQRDLAEVIGVNQSTIARAERCHPSAKLSTYQACADALGVKLSDIFSDDRTPIEVELLKKFRGLSAKSQDKALDLLELVRAEVPETSAEIR